jgi:hypothetical protein
MNTKTNMSPDTNMNTTNIPVTKFVILTIDQSQHSQAINRIRGLMASWNVSVEELLEVVRVTVGEVVPGMVRDTRYSCEVLVGDELWSRWPAKGPHIAMGIALSMLVESGRLPLICVTPRSTNKLYALASLDTVNTWKQRSKSAVEQCDHDAVKAIALID